MKRLSFLYPLVLVAGLLGIALVSLIPSQKVRAADLLASAQCNGDDLEVTITDGDGDFDITGGGAGLGITVPTPGTYLINGPGSWIGVTVEENGGDLQSEPLGDFDCPSPILTATAACNGNNLDINITGGDAPFDVTVDGNLVFDDIGFGPVTVPAPITASTVEVSEQGGDNESRGLGTFTCPSANAPLNATATCNGDDLVVNITSGDGPFNIFTATPASGMPDNGVPAGIHTYTGPDTWDDLQVEETTGNGQITAFGDITCPTVALNVLTPACNGDDLEINIVAGDGPFEISYTGGTVPSPVPGAIGVNSLPGPSTWNTVTVTETSGDGESQPLGDFTCDPVPLDFAVQCNGDDLDIIINDGDAPFTITTSSGPSGAVNMTGVPTGTTTLTGGTPPSTWNNVTVTEQDGDMQFENRGSFTCPPPNTNLFATIQCNGNNLQVNIIAGDAPFEINVSSGPGGPFPISAPTTGSFQVTGGPATWTDIEVDEVGGDQQNFPITTSFTCPPPVALDVDIQCNGNDLDVTINAGDVPFTITAASGPGAFPINVATAPSTTTLTGGAPPTTWTGVTVTEVGGDTEASVPADFTCGTANTALSVTIACNGNDLDVTINAGDAPFTITAASGPGAFPINVATAPSTTTLTGGAPPTTWTGVTVTEVGGDTEASVPADFTCGTSFINFTASAVCNGNNLDVTIAGDAPFTITSTGGPTGALNMTGVAAGVTSLPGPGTWTAVTVAENGGDMQAPIPLGDFTCGTVGPITLNVSAACNINNLRVQINAGDGPFNISGTSGPGLPINNAGIGSVNLPGPGSWDDVTVTETAGDTQSVVLGDFTCPTTTGTIQLAASVACSGNNLQVSITAGDAPFTIGGSGNGLPVNSTGIGTTFYGGPGTWSSVFVRENAGNTQQLNFGTFVCPSTIATATPPVTVTPAPTATPIPPPLCADIDGTTNAVIRADVPAGTVTGGEVYCRVIAQNGQFIQVPAEVGIRAVIDLGVIHAVDVFGLLPNNIPGKDFNNPVQVCLQGSGSLVYLNSQNAPRFAVVLTGTSSQGGYTCGSIPEPGTVVLTTNGGGLPSAPSAAGGGGGGPFTALGDCVIVTQRRVNLRNGPALDTSILAVVPEGVSLVATGRSGRWLRTTYAGTGGWVRAGYVAQFGNCG